MRTRRGYVSSEDKDSLTTSSFNDSTFSATTDISDDGRDKKSISKRKTKYNSKINKKRKKLSQTINAPHGILIPKLVEKQKSGRVCKFGNLDVADKDDNILIIDSACDQSMIHVSACKITLLTDD